MQAVESDVSIVTVKPTSSGRLVAFYSLLTKHHLRLKKVLPDGNCVLAVWLLTLIFLKILTPEWNVDHLRKLVMTEIVNDVDLVVNDMFESDSASSVHSWIKKHSVPGAMVSLAVVSKVLCKKFSVNCLVLNVRLSSQSASSEEEEIVSDHAQYLTQQEDWFSEEVIVVLFEYGDDERAAHVDLFTQERGFNIKSLVKSFKFLVDVEESGLKPSLEDIETYKDRYIVLYSAQKKAERSEKKKTKKSNLELSKSFAGGVSGERATSAIKNSKSTPFQGIFRYNDKPVHFGLYSSSEEAFTAFNNKRIAMGLKPYPSKAIPFPPSPQILAQDTSPPAAFAAAAASTAVMRKAAVYRDDYYACDFFNDSDTEDEDENEGNGDGDGEREGKSNQSNSSKRFGEDDDEVADDDNDDNEDDETIDGESGNIDDDDERSNIDDVVNNTSATSHSTKFITKASEAHNSSPSSSSSSSSSSHSTAPNKNSLTANTTAEGLKRGRGNEAEGDVESIKKKSKNRRAQVQSVDTGVDSNDYDTDEGNGGEDDDLDDDDLNYGNQGDDDNQDAAAAAATADDDNSDDSSDDDSDSYTVHYAIS